jgi:uncharacterized protein HemX
VSTPPPDTTRAPRPSVVEALKAAATSRAGPWAGVAVAIVGAVLAQWQSNQASDDTARVSYEALKAASEANTTAIEAIRQSQLELRTWVKELADAAARRQAASERIIGSKQNKPSARPVPAVPPEPVPPAPPAPKPPAPVRLLPFDALPKAAP